MKKNIVCVALCCIAWASHAQTPDQFSRNAESFSNRSTEVVRNAARSTDKWVKIQAYVSDVKWDVKKTDSLLNPVIALVTLKLYVAGSDRTTSKESAQMAPVGKFDFEVVELTYIQAQSGWQFSNGRHYQEYLKDWTAFKPSPDPAVFTPAGWVIDGFSVQK